MSQQNSGTRMRGVLLDGNKVQSYALKIGVTTCAQLKQKYLNAYPEISSETKTVSQAWNGEQNIDKQPANRLATLFGLKNYEPLLVGNLETCAWEQLICSPDYQADFLHLIDHAKSDLNLVTIGENSHEDLPEISLDSQWHIELTGSPNEYVMIILQSKDIFYQLAPIDTEGCDNIFKIRKMRYPQQKPLFFDKDYGTGRRQLIAVRAKYMDCQVKNLGTTHICSLEELNQFAVRIMNKPENSISVDRYAFMLV